jgi:3-hydroxyacyl-CoA dehydrogenase
LNRLQGALLTEAMRLVADGVVAPDDLDKTVRDGLGLRWSFMGPFETIDLNAPGGVVDYCARYSGFYRRLASDPAPSSVWDKKSAERVAAALGTPLTTAQRDQRTEWRDRRLLALRRHKLDIESQDDQPREPQ